MEILESITLSPEAPSCEEVLLYVNAADRRDIRMRRQNLQDLKAIQEIILVEEDRALSLDEVLARVMAFYGRFVPYRGHTETRRWMGERGSTASPSR
jgi:hypothetical protein